MGTWPCSIRFLLSRLDNGSMLIAKRSNSWCAILDLLNRIDNDELAENLFDHAAVNVGQANVAPTKPKGELGVINTQQVHYRSV